MTLWLPLLGEQFNVLRHVLPEIASRRRYRQALPVVQALLEVTIAKKALHTLGASGRNHGKMERSRCRERMKGWKGEDRIIDGIHALDH